MATNNNPNDINTANKRPEDISSFFDESANSGFKFKDLVFLVLRNLHWFVICALIGGIIAYYNVRQQERIYASSASLLIKTTLNSSGSESLRTSSALGSITTGGPIISTINNEIMVLKSQSIMESMVRELNLNVSYSYKTKMSRRNKDLYKESPIEVVFPEMDEQAKAVFSVKPIDKDHVILDDFGSGIPAMTVRLNDTVISPVGKIVVKPTWRFGDFYDIEITVSHRPVSTVAAIYRGRINVRRDSERNAILKLLVSDTSPLRAADVLNALMDTYNKESIDDQQRVLDYTENFINERIEYLMNDINENEKVFVDFKRSHNIIDTKSYGQAYVAASSALSEEAKKLGAQAEMMRYLLNFAKNNTDQMIPIGAVPVSSEASSVIKKYNDNLVKIEKYKSDGTINNPVAQNLMEEQVSLHASIITVLETNLKGLEDRIDVANRDRTIANSQIQSVPVAQLELGSVERMQGIKESLYLQLLTKREELLMMSPQLEATGKVIDYAQPNGNPVAPDERKSTIIGIIIGLAVPILILVLKNLLDTTIHERVDVQKSSNVPFLGDVPFEKDMEGYAIRVRENGRDSLSESFRLIRSSLEYMKDRKNGAHAIMFTSFMVSSGKTFISTNLATSFALAKRKTVLVDLDIRKGTLFKVFNVSTKAGISNYLSGKTDSIDDIIHSDVNTPCLDIIFSGPVPPNPAELLMSTRLEDLMAELRKRYEYIFLDNVPVGMVADSDIVKRVADTTIMVLRAGKTDKRLLFDVDKFYKDKVYPNICVILNGVNKKRRGYGYYGYGYGYGHEYGYGYGYGYGDEEEHKKKKKWYQRIFKKKKHHHHHHSGKHVSKMNDDGKD